MDIVKSISGGQPLRTTDWEFIQNMEKLLLKAILTGLLPAETSFVVSGMVYTLEDAVAVTEGYFFDGNEICYVPAASFTESESKRLYLVPAITTSENRTFKDTTTHDVWELRRYAVAYESSAPDDGILFNSLPMIGKLSAYILSQSQLNSDLLFIHDLPYETGSGFAPVTAFNRLKLLQNSFGNYMIHAVFTATSSTGQITTLPAGHRPTGDLVGFFYNGTVAPGVLKIKANGNVYVSGASITGPNYITFQYLIIFENTISWELPTTGGSGPVAGDGI